MSYKVNKIAEVIAPYKTKFGVPRQSGMVKADFSKISFHKEYGLDAFEGLKNGNYIWVIFYFDQCNGVEKKLVRPPRLGGNKKIGVFATRSPFRPNNIGMSLVKIIDIQFKEQVLLIVEGLDLVDKTPVLDIKPYHPNADLASDRSEYWFGDGWYKDLEVSFDCEHQLKEDEINFIIDVLGKDPRPAYHNDNSRLYKIELMTYEISFIISNDKVIIKAIIEVK